MLTLSIPAATARADDNGIIKFGQGETHDPQSFTTSPNGQLVLLDKRGDTDFRLIVFSPTGTKVQERAIPAAQIQRPDSAWMDSSGDFFIHSWPSTGSGPGRVISRLPHDEAAPAEKIDEADWRSSIALAKTPAGEALYILKYDHVDCRLLTDIHTVAQTTKLSVVPQQNWFTSFHVGATGDLYGYDGEAGLIYHFSPDGVVAGIFGSAKWPWSHLPGSGVNSQFDVDANGDIYSTYATAGPMLRYTADGKYGIIWNGTPNVQDTDPLYMLRGVSLSGDKMYLANGTEGIIGFPKALAQKDAPGCDTVDGRAWGCEYTVDADKPYKLFTADSGNLRITFGPAVRRTSKGDLFWELRDFSDTVVAQGKIPIDLPDLKQVDFPLSVPLPKLGCYELDTVLKNPEGFPLIGRLDFIGRVIDDPNRPVPAEGDDQDDMAALKMCGLGLHRVYFSSDPKQLAATAATIEAAKKAGIKTFLQITEARDCTPENIAKLFAAIPDLPAVEIVNEPNSMGPQAYVKLLATCYKAVRATGAKTLVLGPALCGTSLPWLEGFFKAGGANFIDVLSFHTYMDPADPDHWEWKFKTIRGLLDKYGGKDKPMWQTEHGDYAEYCGAIPASQTRRLAMESGLGDRWDMPSERYSYFYLKAHGFGFPSYLINGRKELMPAAQMLRAKAEMLEGTSFSKSIEFASPYNWQLLGSLYTGQTKDVVMLMNCGSIAPIDVMLQLPKEATACDLFGNPIKLASDQAGMIRFPVSAYPAYISLPHGAPFSIQPPPMGRNIAPDATVSCGGDITGKRTASRINNGHLEFYRDDDPFGYGFKTGIKLPVDITFQFTAPQAISAVCLYGHPERPPSEFEVQVEHEGKWVTVSTVNDHFVARPAPPHEALTRITYANDPWIFVQQFPVITGDAVRLHVTQIQLTDWSAAPWPGGGPEAEAQRLWLREVQIFSPAPGKESASRMPLPGGSQL